MAGPGALELFHPLVADWFTRRVGRPTDVQEQAWPRIAAGEHLLITAPTGSGKTLTAFLWALDRLLCGDLPGGALRVLYVSPLKALNNDIQRNLLGPLAALQDLFHTAGEPHAEVRVMTRSGDTEAAERRRMIRQPPEILITTPESLNILLATPAARNLFAGLQTVILDEIHAVAETKRGTHLITAVDRLVPLAGEFQRLALSATVRPLERIAEFIGGWRREGERYLPRPVGVLRGGGAKEYHLTVRLPESQPGESLAGQWWTEIARQVREIIKQHRSTLVFCNSRRQAERLTLLLNDGEPRPLAYSHHGSLSRETRLVVEERLKRGELAAIVATGSLELGIDIGALDAVVLVETPFDVATAIQRLGRAGHQVGQISRGMLFPGPGKDLLAAAVLADCLPRQDIEETRPLRGPLDVLAQILVAQAGVEPRRMDDLYAELRCSYPYHELPRRVFDLVLAMLAGRYAETRLPALQPRLIIDRLEGTVTARDGSLRLVYASGGTIPDRGYYTLRHADSRTRIGELDEEFVWEQNVGTTFTFGTQTWRIEAITHNDVLVRPASQARMMPFWKGDPYPRSSHFATRQAELLQRLEPRLEQRSLAAELAAELSLDPAAADALIGLLRVQAAATNGLPHRRRIIAEIVDTHEIGAEAERLIYHTFWGGSVNRPLALALAAVLAERDGLAAQTYADDTCVAIIVPLETDPSELLRAVVPERLETLLRQTLETSGYFGARFRENAGRALLLPRGSFRQRMPLWLTRARAKQLLELVASYDDFPIIAETWRTCLQDEFELDVLSARLAEMRSGETTLTVARTRFNSPFADSIVWRQTNELMYLDDTPRGGRSALRGDLLEEVVFSARLRPELDPDQVAEFQAKLHRTCPGYEPQTAAELVDLIRHRLVVPLDEWAALLAGSPEPPTSAEAGRLGRLRLPGAGIDVVLAVENLTRVAEGFGLATASLALEPVIEGAEPALAAALAVPPPPVDEVDPLAEIVAQWLQFTGPVPLPRLTEVFGLAPALLDSLLADLIEERRVVVDRLTRGAITLEVCDADHLERLLRLARRARTPEFAPLPAARLPYLIAAHQGLIHRGTGRAGLQRALEPLLGYVARAELWETEILPARVADYQTAWLDGLMAETGLLYFGQGEAAIGFAFDDQLDLVRDELGPADELDLPPGRYRLDELADRLDLATGPLSLRLWAALWAGRVTNDSPAALRQGLQSRFQPVAPTRSGGRRGAARWQASRPFAGQWRRLPLPAPPGDRLDELERQKERVRLLLDRYGLLCRELLAREAPALQWSRLLEAMRLMELSGELVAGCFCEGLAGVQFTTPALLDTFRREPDPNAVWWLNAVDPASLCGAGVQGLADLPARRPTTLLVYLGERPVVIAERSGQELTIHLSPDDPRLPDCLACLGERQRREFQPVGTLTITRINGQPADDSPYLPALRELYRLSVEFRRVRLWRQPK